MAQVERKIITITGDELDNDNDFPTLDHLVPCEPERHYLNIVYHDGGVMISGNHSYPDHPNFKKPEQIDQIIEALERSKEWLK